MSSFDHSRNEKMPFQTKKEKEKHVEVIDLQFYQSPHQLKLFVLNEESIFYSKSSSVCFKYHFMKTLNQHSKHQL